MSERPARKPALTSWRHSIAAHGLLNPLTVRPSAKGKYAVVAGQRRLMALQRLAKAGTVPKGAAIACHLAGDAQDPAELSLAENVVRIAMHPADQFEAWRGLIDRGASPGDIAARFGVPDSTVRKRMALARVSPRLFDLYRQGALDLEALQAFTISPTTTPCRSPSGRAWPTGSGRTPEPSGAP